MATPSVMMLILLAGLANPGPQAQTPPQASTADRQGIEGLDPGMWLVNLARHQGHLVGRADPRSASLHVLALVEAATRVSPDCAEAYQWSYDLFSRLGRESAAREALDQYVRLRPEDEVARIRSFELELGGLNTAHARADFVKGELSHGPHPPAYESELRLALARFHYERRQNEDAAREIERSLRLNPMNIPARELGYEMFAETEPVLQRVELGLQMIAANPSQASLLWDLAEFLDQASLHEQAQERYTRAIEMHEASGAGEVPPDRWYRLALSYTNSKNFKQARSAATIALKADPTLRVARLLRSHAAAQLNDPKAAAADLDEVEREFESRIPDVIENKDCDAAAEIAWFYCYHRPNKERALELSRVAMDTPTPGSLARLAHAYALRLNHQDEEAIKILEPLSRVDQLAALELARAHLDSGHRSTALTVLHKAATLQYSGIAYDMIDKLLREHGEVPPEPPSHSKVVKALERFDRRILDYHKHPDEFLKFAMRFEDRPFAPSGPVNVTFELANVGPIPISFGDGYMARPLIAVSAEVGENPPARYSNYLQVMINSRRILSPGDALRKTVAVDIGPIREQLVRSAVRPQLIKITALFDPVFQDGELTSGLGTIAAAPIEARCEPVDTGSVAIAASFDRARSGDVRARASVADAFGALIASARNGASGPVLQGVDLDAIRKTLASLLADHDWQVRARAVVACGWAPLDPTLISAAAGAVRDENAVVRMLAVRLFAEQQGAKFQAVLDAMSRGDPDRLVRIMARSFVQDTSVAVNGEDAPASP